MKANTDAPYDKAQEIVRDMVSYITQHSKGILYGNLTNELIFFPQEVSDTMAPLLLKDTLGL